MKDLKNILQEKNFKFDKALGQNFITDTNLLKAIAADSGIDKNSLVIEVGAGGGTLTKELSSAAKKVYAYEIDCSLEPVLSETLKGCDNIELRFCDIMKQDIKKLEKDIGGSYSMVANLPYYITTPLIMKFIENAENLLSMTVMVQKEVAERLCAAAGGKNYGSVSVAVEFAGGARIMRKVDRRMFLPVPNVDSAVVRIDIKRDKYKVNDRALFYRLYRCAFAMRRKTLLNNMTSALGISKGIAEKALTECGFGANIRGETLSAADFTVLSDKLSYLL